MTQRPSIAGLEASAATGTASSESADPRHVAIIMDGNGRWAKRRGLPRAEGHRRGVDAVRRVVRSAIELTIPYLTIYSFSSENWSRPPDEVDDLMSLMKRFIRQDLVDLHQNGVRLRVIGERNRLDPELLRLMDEAVDLTRDNAKLNLIVAFNYGSRTEIARAAQRLASCGCRTSSSGRRPTASSCFSIPSGRTSTGRRSRRPSPPIASVSAASAACSHQSRHATSRPIRSAP